MTPQNFLDDLLAWGYEDTDINVKLRALNFAIKKVAYRKPWAFMQKVSSLTFDGTNPYPTSQPADLRISAKLMDTSTGKRVRYADVDEIENIYGASLTQTGTPQFYYFEGTQLRVWPIPPAGTLRFRYFQTHPDVLQGDPESAILVPVAGHEAILFRTVMRLADLEDDDEIAARMDPLFRTEMRELDEVLGVQQLDTNDHIMVVDNDDFGYS